MRIGMVTATYPPSLNGVAIATDLFAQALRARGHDVQVFAPFHPKRSDRVPGIHPLPSSSRLARWCGVPEDYPVLLPTDPWALHREAAKLDVIHSMHPFIAGRLALRWGRRHRVPVVFTAHTQYDQYLHYLPVSGLPAQTLLRRHLRQFTQQVNAVTTPGEGTTAMLRRVGYRGPVQVLRNPVELRPVSSSSDERAAFRSAHGLSQSAAVVISVGRLAPEKNLPLLLNAFQVAQRQRPDLQLLLVGDGVSRVEIERAAPAGVVLTGALPHPQIPMALAAADVFITASTTESFPLSMLEALAAGIPLVAPQSPAALEIITSGLNGFVTAPSATELGTGLLAALEPARRPHLSAGARASAYPYHLPDVAATLEQLYLNTAARYGKRRASPLDLQVN